MESLVFVALMFFCFTMIFFARYDLNDNINDWKIGSLCMGFLIIACFVIVCELLRFKIP